MIKLVRYLPSSRRRLLLFLNFLFLYVERGKQRKRRKKRTKGSIRRFRKGRGREERFPVKIYKSISYWVDQKVHSGFSRTSCKKKKKTWTNLLANSIYQGYHIWLQEMLCRTPGRTIPMDSNMSARPAGVVQGCSSKQKCNCDSHYTHPQTCAPLGCP